MKNIRQLKKNLILYQGARGSDVDRCKLLFPVEQAIYEDLGGDLTKDGGINGKPTTAFEKEKKRRLRANAQAEAIA